MFKIIQSIITRSVDGTPGLLAVFCITVLPIYVSANDTIDQVHIDRFYDLVIIPIPNFPITGLHFCFVLAFAGALIGILRRGIKAWSELTDARTKDLVYRQKEKALEEEEED